MLQTVVAARVPIDVLSSLPLPRTRRAKTKAFSVCLRPPDPGPLPSSPIRDGYPGGRRWISGSSLSVGSFCLSASHSATNSSFSCNSVNGGSHSHHHAHGGHSHSHEHSNDHENEIKPTSVLNSSSPECQDDQEHDEHDDHDHEHDEHEHDHHHHHHSFGHHQHGHSHDTLDPAHLNAVQKVLHKVFRMIGVAAIANMWRDNLKACCMSLAMLLLGALAPYVLPQSLGSSVQSALVLPAIPLTAVPAGVDAAIDVAGGKVNIHVLMAVAAFASCFMGSPLEGGLLLAMFSLSHLAEDYFTERALGDVKALKAKNPESALVLEPFDLKSPPPLSSIPYKKVNVNRVKIGSYLLVKAGETVPVDGEVWQGRAKVTVEHLTGEAQPVEKRVGDSVPGGARSLDGVMIVKASKTWKDSTVARIVKLTEEAHHSRPSLQRWLDEFGERYSQGVVGMSLAVAFLGPLLFKWPFFSSAAGVRGSVYRALGLMVAASPCALAVAPLAYAAAISACANKGILLKGGEALDALAQCDVVAFDKTGTLTTGDLVCKAIEPLHGHICDEDKYSDEECCVPNCEDEALAVAAAMERGATHPIARAVMEHSAGKELPEIHVDNFHTVPGEGLFANVAQTEAVNACPSRALLGSVEYIASSFKNPVESDNVRQAASASVHGNELVQAALSVNNKVTLFHFEDKLRPHAADVIKTLQKQAGLHCVMLTGDRHASAQRVASAVGIDEVHSGLKPEDKLHRVISMSRQKGRIGGLIMVGDGINDAPALAAATVGIVLAKRASGTAIAVADVLLLQDAIDGVSFVIAKAKQTTHLVEQSVALALSCIILAGLSSVLGFLPLWLTVLLHEGGTLLVCMNSARALHDPVWSRNLHDVLPRFLRRLHATVMTKLKREESRVELQTASA
ncbi:hypothetical protein R1sor_019206 [Riccia sorocarpa]|uniref:P-type ATPase A domain-containing protein n=1 Tax=Riccia sorocarpa TaxID=122646 RepID=A0ABD3IDK8_9MARC